MRYAVVLAHHGHFGRAADALGTTQPTLSRQIARPERDVGVRLFDRGAQGVVPTAAGEAFLVRAQRALAEVAGAEVDAHRAARADTGRLRVGFDTSALLSVLPDTLVLFSRSHPHVQLQMQEMASAESGRALLRGRIDIAISRGAPRGAGAEDLVSVPVERAHLAVVVGVGHPFAGAPPVTASSCAVSV